MLVPRIQSTGNYSRFITRKAAPKASEASKKLSNVQWDIQKEFMTNPYTKQKKVKCGSGDSSCFGDSIGAALPMGFSC